MSQTRVVIVDDNEDALDILEFYLMRLGEYDIVDKCRNGEELIDSVVRNHPDLILLDINMPKLNGVEAIRSCLKIKGDLMFIFITSYDEYAVEAFELSALDYIVKPIEKSRLYASLEKVKKMSSSIREQGQWSNAGRLHLRDGNNFYYIPWDEIIFIEKVGKKSCVYTSTKEYVTNAALAELMIQLPMDRFYLTHRSYLVNLSKIAHISARNQTYLTYFEGTSKYAHISKLKIDDVHSRLNP